MFKRTRLAATVSCILLGTQVTFAQDASEQSSEEQGLETITVTAQKRTQSIQDVPISISALNGEKFEAIFSGGDDILALAARAPGLYAETSNGRVAPRFYLRGLGNTDFDLAASQPVAIMIDDVVKENVVLKSFPLFDIQQVEVLRGPQGTLFGRNTTAGVVKFDTRRPTQDFEAFAEVAVGNLGTVNLEGAVGGALNDEFSARFSVLSQNRDDWISNGFTGEEDVMGGFNELAWRAQLLWEPSSIDGSALVSVYGRDLDGTSSIFRANGVSTGSNDFNDSYDRDLVYYDADLDGDGQQDKNPQDYETTGVNLRLEYNIDRNFTFTSITAYETAEGSSLGDVDGGVNLNEPGDIDGNGTTETSFPGFIPFSSVTEDQMDDLSQFTQEFRLVNTSNADYTWTLGAFIFDSEFDVTSIDGFFGATTVSHSNESWALFGQVDYDVSDDLTISAGLNYTDDEKSLVVGDQNVDGFALVIGAAAVQDIPDVNVDDSQISGSISVNYKLSDSSSVYTRIATGFRAPTIQGRDVAFESFPSVADSETLTSIEVGFKTDLLDDTLRLNGAVYYYENEDMQFSAIGGSGNLTQLINADKGIGQGFEIEATYLATDYLTLTAGYSYNNTEIDDPNLRVAACGNGQCTITNPLDENGLVIVDGNPFPQAPESTLSFTARYAVPLGDDGEFFAYTDWIMQGETNLFLYEAVETTTDTNFEGGLRLGYENFEYEYTVSFFARNITDEENLRGAIDFNNLTVIDNQPRVFGLEFRKTWY